MYNVIDFVIWALRHAKFESFLEYSSLPASIHQCCREPWHYLFGSVRVRTTKAAIESYWKNHYCKQSGWTRDMYNTYTYGWRDTDYATDCQGLLDAYLTYECGEKTDVNADMNYKQWSTDVCKITDTDRPYVIGEALFCVNSSGKATHVGWICGTDVNGEPLAVEARGLVYGVVVTRVNKRAWTHRGLMTRKCNYNDNQNDTESEVTSMATKFEVTSPMSRGDNYKTMQAALNANGYTDAKGRKLTEDGKWGENSQAAFDKLLAAHMAADKPKEDKPANESAAYIIASEDGGHKLRITVEEVG